MMQKHFTGDPEQQGHFATLAGSQEPAQSSATTSSHTSLAPSFIFMARNLIADLNAKQRKDDSENVGKRKRVSDSVDKLKKLKSCD